MWLTGGTDEISGLDYSLVKLTSEEFDKKMCTEFPKILGDRNKPMSTTCMCWGFEVGPGWQHLLYKLFSQLQAIYDVTGILVIADQIKEKYGTLRFYHHLDLGCVKVNKDMWAVWEGIIDKLCDSAEADTGHICETCGKYYKHDPIYIGTWVYADCVKCFKKNNPDMLDALDEWYTETKQAEHEDD